MVSILINIRCTVNKIVILMVLVLWADLSMAATGGLCEGASKEAVIELPEPLNQWAQIICTPYGHVISNKVGWVWEQSDGSRPVIAMIPSQMVKSNPKPLGNGSYFKNISLERAGSAESQQAISKFEQSFSKQSNIANVYKSTITPANGDALAFQFFEYEDGKWGMQCDRNCTTDFRFMVSNPRVQRLVKPR